MNTDVAILGNGLAGNLAAAYLRKHLPNLTVTIIGKEDAERPIVGESTVEYAARFFHEIGLAGLLEEKHYHKFGLTFIQKENLDDPSCRSYIPAGAPGIPRIPSYQINREVFDRDLEQLNCNRGTKFVWGWVRDIDLRGDSRKLHEITYTTPSEQTQALTARWVIDATGRRGFLARRLKLRRKDKERQRSSFWFRLRDFDKNYLNNIEVTQPRHHAYDPYYATQHFFGRGNWIWNIPMRSEKDRDLLSVGISWRPDLYPHSIRNIDDFQTHVRKEHPVLTELVESGRVVDENLLLNYKYDSSQYYSADGWFLLGDAAFAPDPLFSFGTSYIAAQISQITRILQRDIEGQPLEEYVGTLNEIFDVMMTNSQEGITNLYECMHRPMEMHWKLMDSTTGWFFSLLPALMKGMHTEPIYLDMFKARPTSEDPLHSLLEHVQERIEKFDPAKHTPNLYDYSIDWSLYRSTEEGLGLSLARMLWRRVKHRHYLTQFASPSRRVTEMLQLARLVLTSAVLRAYPKMVPHFEEPAMSRTSSFLDPLLKREHIGEYWPDVSPKSGGAPRVEDGAPREENEVKGVTEMAE